MIFPLPSRAPIEPWSRSASSECTTAATSVAKAWSAGARDERSTPPCNEATSGDVAQLDRLAALYYCMPCFLRRPRRFFRGPSPKDPRAQCASTGNRAQDALRSEEHTSELQSL